MYIIHVDLDKVLEDRDTNFVFLVTVSLALLGAELSIWPGFRPYQHILRTCTCNAVNAVHVHVRAEIRLVEAKGAIVSTEMGL